MNKTCNSCGKKYESEIDLLMAKGLGVCQRNYLWINCSCKSTLMIPLDKNGNIKRAKKDVLVN